MFLIRGEANTGGYQKTQPEVMPELECQVEVFPNPSQGKIQIRWDGFDGTPIVTVTDFFGKTLREINTSSSEIELDLSDLSKGMYFIHLDDGGSHMTKKLILN